MIIIPRKEGESIVIDDDIVLTVVEISGDKIRFQIDSPKDVSIQRSDAFAPVVGQNGIGSLPPR